MAYGNNRATMWTLVTVIGVILLALIVLAWLANDNDVEDAVNETQNTISDTQNSAEEALDTNDDLLSQIIDNPDSYYGQTVTVAGEIQDVYNRRVFSISDQTVGDELLIVTRNPLTQRQAEEGEEFFEDNADISATGEIKQLDVQGIESEFGLTIPEEIEIEITSGPVLVADSFTFSDNNAFFDFTQGPDEQQQ